MFGTLVIEPEGSGQNNWTKVSPDTFVSDGAASEAPGDIQVLCALRAGARGYILKGHVHKELLETIRALHAGHKCIPPDIAAELADHTTDDALTEREIDALS